MPDRPVYAMRRTDLGLDNRSFICLYDRLPMPGVGSPNHDHDHQPMCCASQLAMRHFRPYDAWLALAQCTYRHARDESCTSSD